MTMEPPRLLDPDDLMTMPECDNYELIDGIPVEMEMSTQSEAVAFDLAAMLRAFVNQHRLGRVFGSNVGFSAFPGRPKLFRKPDAMFFAGQYPIQSLPDRVLTIAPDLAVEVVSPENSANEIDEKVELYRSAGVKLIWVIYPKTVKAYVHRLNGTTSEVGRDGILDGEDVVPGFQCRIAELFED